MKKIYFLILFYIFAPLFSQKNEEAEMKNLIAGEAKKFSKLSDFNVNPNTLNYDLRYQRLELEINPSNPFISGSVISHFVPKENISSIYFDLTHTLTVSEVKYHGNNLSFSQLSTKEIKIDFPQNLPSNILDSLSISYFGAPNAATRGLYFQNHQGEPVAFSITEPYGSREWFPTKQSLNDKIEKIDLKITTPSQFSAAANGILLSETNLPNNKKQAFWQTNYPIPAYLIAIGVANYVKINDTMGNPPFPYVNYIFNSTNNNPSEMSNVEWTKTVMNTFEEHFGAYPYRNEKYGHMEMTFYGSGMEHATMSTMGGFGKDLIAHELAHQWFGDKITCGAWNDIWLNEGFAVFAQHLAKEKLFNTPTEFRNYLASQKNFITSDPNGSVYVPDAELANENRVFNGRLTYDKGGFVLRMMKWVLGEEPFYQAIRDYTSRPNLAYQYATTPDFKASVLQSTGQDFSEFLNDWIYGEGFPTYTIKWNQLGNQVFFNVNQTQSNPSVSFFELPLPIKANGTNGEIAYFKLNNINNNQNFNELVNFTISSMEFNYDYQILERNSTVILDPALSVENIQNLSLKIYPNPAKEILHISGISGKKYYEIIGADGKLVLKGNTSENINISSLAKGMYIFKIEGKTFKFIKE